MAQCISTTCGRSAQPEHTPCCSSHLHPLCCTHYNRRHHIDFAQCTPQSHEAAKREVRA